LILRKIIKIVATKCPILKLKCTKFDYGCGSATDLAIEELTALPQTIAGYKGAKTAKHRNTKQHHTIARGA